MKITEEKLQEQELKAKFQDASQLGFGRIFTDRMFTMRYANNEWTEAKIEKYKNFTLDPSACVFHYSQEIFEGMKAYAAEDGRILLFRPEQNVRRMNNSAARLVMPTIPEEDMLQAIEELVLAEKNWIPRAAGTSMYIRPTMIATEAFLGVHPSAEYTFFVILSPVGAYYKGGFQPVKLYVEDTFVRAAVGGVGDIKTGGNYAASLMAGYRAQQKGFSQVLWLDAKERKYVEEVGAMNMFFVYGNKLVTPALSGSILPGITRASVLELAKHLGLTAEERTISIDEVIEDIATGAITEAFGSGTAAVISPVGSLTFKEKEYVINNNQVGPNTQHLYDTLVNIQYGRQEDPFGWVKEIGRL
ncbi:branched-chain amino acid aminotransferase [Desulforamulus aeronauticus]|uniref:Branched-chain-amino-acid aminotransferase n=1 Tax=Desulforamulus aeronauticus DSM 10349 TaxID=1121421 RepID=A0A1M6W6Q2_9FIRM|nr:branched-chain amino acid aminotransferase [Desulforamulus aeronauticus]SHK89423.1 branched-chain amino acid aminotransferase [Desulforamulus aeronauticus DSM 10349]